VPCLAFVPELSVKRPRKRCRSRELRPTFEPSVQVKDFGIDCGQRLAAQVTLIRQPRTKGSNLRLFHTRIGPCFYGLAKGFGEISQNRATFFALNRFGHRPFK
jgi:hypothetical protein